MVSKKKSLQPSTAREKVTKSTELESLRKWVKGRMKYLQYHVVSSNIHLSSRLLSQDKLFPTLPSIGHSWHFNEAKSGVSAISEDEHQNIKLCFPLFQKN